MHGHEHEGDAIVVAPAEHTVEATGHVVEAVPGVGSAEHLAEHIADAIEENAEAHRLEETVESAAETADRALEAATLGQVHDHADLSNQLAELRVLVERHVADDEHHRAEHEAEHVAEVEAVEPVEPVTEVSADRESEHQDEGEHEHREHRERPRRRGFLRGRR